MKSENLENNPVLREEDGIAVTEDMAWAGVRAADVTPRYPLDCYSMADAYIAMEKIRRRSQAS